MNKIQQWLKSDRDYTTGLNLLRKECDNKTLLAVLSSGETRYNKKRLLRELNAYRSKPEEAPVFTAAPRKEIKEVGIGRPAIEAFPPALHPAFKRQDKLYALVNHLHPQLDTLYKYNQGECKNAVNALVDAWAEIDAIYRILDYYTKHGTILNNKYMPAPEAEPMSFAQVVKRVRNLRTYISKYKNNVKRQLEVKAWRKELAELELKIENG